MNTEYDFFGMGVRHANEGMLNLKRVAKEIGEKYGEDAKLEFESGIATTIPTYSQFMQNEMTQKEVENSSAINAEMNNYRNNSYFGGHGISQQYRPDSSGHITYNDPQGKVR